MYLIINHRDEAFFSTVELSIIKSDSTILYNSYALFKHIKKYYYEVIEVEIESDFYNVKEAVGSSNKYNILPLVRLNIINKIKVELLLGVAAKCRRNNYYIDIMKSMLDQDSRELLEILDERISRKKTESEIVRLRTEFEEDKELLSLKIDNLTTHNNNLREENNILSKKNDELTRSTYSQELNMKDLEAKYNELLVTLEKHYTDTEVKNDDETVVLSMQISELRAKLEAKEKSFVRFKEEHERFLNEHNTKLSNLQHENEILKERSLKYDILREKYERTKQGISLFYLKEDSTAIKHKLIRYEKSIKDLEEKLKFYKNFGEEKTKLLSKIEELHVIIEENKEAIAKLNKEISFYKNKALTLDSENTKLKKEVEYLKIEIGAGQDSRRKSDYTINDTENIEYDKPQQSKESLSELEINSNLHSTILELEMKVVIIFSPFRLNYTKMKEML